MTKKTDKVVSLVNNVNIDAITSEISESVTKSIKESTDSIENLEQKKQQFKKELDDSFKHHQESATLAFELLKSILNGNTTYIIDHTEFKPLIRTVYNIATSFKDEVNGRWTSEITKLSNKIYGNADIKKLLDSVSENK